MLYKYIDIIILLNIYRYLSMRISLRENILVSLYEITFKCDVLLLRGRKFFVFMKTNSCFDNFHFFLSNFSCEQPLSVWERAERSRVEHRLK